MTQHTQLRLFLTSQHNPSTPTPEDVEVEKYAIIIKEIPTNNNNNNNDTPRSNASTATTHQNKTLLEHLKRSILSYISTLQPDSWSSGSESLYTRLTLHGSLVSPPPPPPGSVCIYGSRAVEIWGVPPPAGGAVPPRSYER